MSFWSWLFGDKKAQIIPAPKFTETPWMDWMKAHEGLQEVRDNDKLWPLWKYTTFEQGLKDKSVIGSEHAWCAMTVNAALFESGYTGNRSPAAISFRDYGTPCGFVYGAILPIRHEDGSCHVNFFVEWADELNQIAKCFGGNQNNEICVKQYYLSNYDEVVPGPRWPVK